MRAGSRGAPARAFGLLLALAACGHAGSGEVPPPAVPHAAGSGSGNASGGAGDGASGKGTAGGGAHDAVDSHGASVLASVPVPPEPRSRERREARPAKWAALRFELNGRAFPLPLVHGSIGGEPVWMLVDTGTNPHVLAGWVARKLHLGLRPLNESVSDHAGRAIKVYGVLNARASIDGWGAIDTGGAMVADFPEAIETMGIGAFVSPQALAAEGEGVVLDLYRHEMHSLPWEQAVKTLDAPGTPHAAALGGDHLRLCRDDSKSASGLTFVLPALVAGHGAQLLLDTGAPNTDLLLTSRAGSSLLGQSSASAEPMYAASGLVRTRVVHEARVKLGSWSVTTDVDLVPGSADRSCPRDGALSMDVLSKCVLVVGRRALVGRCGP